MKDDPVDGADPGKPRPRRWARRALAIALLFTSVVGVELASRAWTPESYGRVTEPAVGAALAKLRAAVDEHQRSASELSREARVTAWLTLFHRFANIQGELECGEANEFLDQLFVALPPAPDWPALDAAIRAKATPLDLVHPNWLALSALGNYLNARPGSMLNDARNLSRAVAVLGWKADWQAEVLLDTALHLDGRFEVEVARIVSEATHREHRRHGRVTVPELHDLMTPEQARSVIEQALLLSDPVEVRRGPRTLAVARRLALDLAPRLRCAQFELAQGLDQGPLFDALSRRFPATAEQCHSERGGFEHRERMTAAAYRVADLLRQGRDPEARALVPFLPIAMRGYVAALDGPAAADSRRRPGHSTKIRKLPKDASAR